MSASRWRMLAGGLTGVTMLILTGTAAAGLGQANSSGFEGWYSWSTEHRTIERSVYGVWARPMVVVATSPADWNRRMKGLEDRGALLWAPAPPVPEGVDWSREAVVLVALGPVPYTRYEVEVVRAEERGGRLRLKARLRPLMPGHVMAASPYHLLAVKRGGWYSRLVRCDYRMDDGTEATVPLAARWSGLEDGEPGVTAASWGEVKDLYR